MAAHVEVTKSALNCVAQVTAPVSKFCSESRNTQKINDRRSSSCESSYANVAVSASQQLFNLIYVQYGHAL